MMRCDHMVAGWWHWFAADCGLSGYDEGGTHEP